MRQLGTRAVVWDAAPSGTRQTVVSVNCVIERIVRDVRKDSC